MTESRGQKRLMVVDHFDPETARASGIDTVIRGFIGGGGFASAVIVGTTDNPAHRLRRPVELTFENRSIVFLPVASSEARRALLRLPDSLRFGFGLLRARRRIKRLAGPAEVHAHRAETGALLRVFGITNPVQFVHNSAANLTSSGSDSVWRHARWLYRLIERTHVASARGLVVFNAAEAARLATLNQSTFHARTWFDQAVFYPSTERKADDSGVLKLAWVGRIDHQKDPGLAVEVLARVRRRGVDARATFVGDGVLIEQIRDQARALGLQDSLTLAGALDRAAVAAVMRDARVLLMTSRYEGSPTVLVEALACGAAVAATTSSDPDQLLASGTAGVCVDSRDPSELASAVLAAARLPVSASLDIARSRSIEVLLGPLVAASSEFWTTR